MSSNKVFFDRIARHILTDCHSEADYIKDYEKIREYMKSHQVDSWETKEYYESGASELLAMITIDYRKKKVHQSSNKEVIPE